MWLYQLTLDKPASSDVDPSASFPENRRVTHIFALGLLCCHICCQVSQHLYLLKSEPLLRVRHVFRRFVNKSLMSNSIHFVNILMQFWHSRFSSYCLFVFTELVVYWCLYRRALALVRYLHHLQLIISLLLLHVIDHNPPWVVSTTASISVFHILFI